MTATLLPVPRARFFSPAGLPLAGGKVFTYVAGTTTPLASYTDYSGTVANTNPVILDANGEANIWLDSQLYKIVLRDADDVTLWTVDNVGQNSIAELAAGFGAATNIASAATVDLGTLASHFGNITGATNISSFGSSASLDAPVYLVKFNGTLTITHSANLLCPGSANITTSANDRAWCEYLGSGAWRIYNYMKADANPISSGTANQIMATPAGAAGVVGVRTMVPADMPSATETAQGAVELATVAEVRTGTDAVRAITPAGIKGALGVSTSSFSSEQTIPASNTILNVAHGLGAVPLAYQIVLRCKTAELSYSVDDEVDIATMSQGSAIQCTRVNATNISYINNGTPQLPNLSTGSYAGITTGNWRLVFRAWL